MSKSAVLAAHLLDRLPLAVLATDPRGRITFANVAYCTMFGLPLKADVVGRDGAALLREDGHRTFADPAATEAAIAASVAAGTDLLGLLVPMQDGRILERDALLAEDGWLITYRDVTEREQARVVREELALIPHQNPNPIFRIAVDGQVLFQNPAAAALRESLTLAQQVEGGHELQALMGEAMTTGVPSQISMQNGGRWFDAYLVPFPDRQYVNLYLVESTARHAAEAELRRQKAFYEHLLAHLPAEVVVMGTDLRYRYANAEAIPDPIVRDWVIGHDDLEYFTLTRRPLAMVEQRLQVLRLAIAERRQVQWDEALPRTDGSGYRHFARFIQPVFDAAGELEMLIGYGLDITAIYQAQEVLQQSEKRYRDLMQYSQALICTHTLDGQVLAVNPATCKLLGLPAEKLMGQSIALALPSQDRGEVAKYLKWFATAAENTSSGLVRVLPHRAAAPHYLLYNNVRVEEPGQEPYIIGYAQDVTERIRAEKAAKQAQSQAEEAMRARESFLANMSHEIRTPLNGVLGLTALLAKTPLTADQHRFVDLIGTAGQTLLALLNDVLDLSKITSGHMELAAQPFDLCHTVRDAAQSIGIRALEKGIGFSIVPLDMPEAGVIGDSHRLTQIVTNLLANAVKFTEKGGVTLQGDVKALTPAAITVRFLVRDTGIGIPTSMQEAVFEEFTQAYADTSRRYGGTGLGLAISARLVSQMGGQLVLASVIGEGTTFGFTLTLPRAPVLAALPVAAPALAALPNLRGRRVLLAEDHAVNRLLARLILDAQGAEVEEAVDGAEAVRLATHAAPFDVVLMDIQMPHLNGLQATAAIRALPDPRRANVPIVALTANAFRSDVERYLAAGMNDCLTKPFAEADLLRLLAGILRPTEPVPAAATPTATTGFPATIRRLTQGNEVALNGLVMEFLDTTPALLAALEAPTTTPDQVARLAHQLVPTARLFDAPELASTLTELENLSPTHPRWADMRQYAVQLLTGLIADVFHQQVTMAATRPETPKNP